MNFKRYLISTLALFVFIFIYEMLVHGFLLMGMYQATASVWRHYEISTSLPLALCFQFALSAWTAFIFSQLFKNGGIKNGLLFGLFIGVFAGILTASWYQWLDVPATLGLAWFIGATGEGLGGGLILGSIYRK
jgi:hypothetical protein